MIYDNHIKPVFTLWKIILIPSRQACKALLSAFTSGIIERARESKARVEATQARDEYLAYLSKRDEQLAVKTK